MKDNLTAVERWIINHGKDLPLYVWGTGSSAKAFIEAYPNISVSAFVQNGGSNKLFYGKNCYSPESIDLKKGIVIIASEFYEEIEYDLLRLGISKSRFVTHSELMMKDADCCLISYQKAGRTWLRTMIGRYYQLVENLDENDILKITESGAFYSNLRPEMPNIVAHHDDNAHRKVSDELSRDKSYYNDKKVIFLCRDPRDVIVSNFYHMKYRAKSYEGTLNEFVLQYFSGIIEFYNIWATQKTQDKIIVKYESLKGNTNQNLHHILKFIDPNYPIYSNYIDNAVNYSSLENMKSYENTNKFNTEILNKKSEDPRGAKVRRGKIGSYKNELEKYLIDECNEIINNYLNPIYGY